MIALTIDCNDLESMTTFWSEFMLTDVQGIHEPFAFLAPPEGSEVSIWLQRVPEERAGKVRIHLDFAAEDLDAATRRVEALGGSVGDQHHWETYTWKQCFDPEGNVFDIMQAPSAEPAAEPAE
jgi:predicted enzyme related to lactoylglutathione lyase